MVQRNDNFIFLFGGESMMLPMQFSLSSIIFLLALITFSCSHLVE
jgi:hypothetical protein